MKKILLSVIIPAYNEEENVRHGVLLQVWQYLKQQQYRWEVIIVDDGSIDKTATLVASFVKQHKGFSLLLIRHSGKAGAIIAGFKKAKGEILLFTDFDQSVPIGEIEKVLPLLNSGLQTPLIYPSSDTVKPGSREVRNDSSRLRPAKRDSARTISSLSYDIVIGSRISRKGAPLSRKLTGYGFILIRKLLLGLPYHDTQCGFKAFTRGAAGKIMKRMIIFSRDTKRKGYAPNAGFDLALLTIAQDIGLKVAEVPVEWRHRYTNEFNTLKVSFLALRDIIYIYMFNRSWTNFFFSHFSRSGDSRGTMRS